jgi:hypothetical protein
LYGFLFIYLFIYLFINNYKLVIPMTNQPTKLEVNTAETTPGESGDKSWVSGHNWLLF